MRCLALAQAWQESVGAPVHLVCGDLPDTLASRVAAEGFTVHRIAAPPGSREDAELTLRIAVAVGGRAPERWVVTDGYAFDLDYQRAVRAAGFRLLAIDDYNHLPVYECDVLFNQNISAAAYPYVVNDDACLLLGPRYALLRREFVAAEPPARHFDSSARNLLITLGGADPDNITARLLGFLAAHRGLGFTTRVLLGGGNAHRPALEAWLRREAVPGVELIVDARNMPELMAWADVAVSAGGSTCWELCRMGVPFLVLVLAENQRRIADTLDAEQVARQLGWGRHLGETDFIGALQSLRDNGAARMRCSRAGRALVDGQGCARVVDALARPALRMRDVTIDDARLLFEWANDADTRAASFSSAAIVWESHQRWLAQRLANPRVHQYIADADGQPVAVVRFDPDENEAVISVALSPAQRGRGLGAIVIEAGVARYAERTGCRRIRALIKPENQRSLRAFQRAGFVRVGETQVQGASALLLAWEAGRV